MHKRYLLIILLAAIVSLGTNAQNRPDHSRRQEMRGQDRGQRFNPEEFKQHMDAYIRQHAGLNDEMAAAALPLLHEMQDQMRKLGDESRRLKQSVKQETSAEDAKKTLDQVLALNQRMTAVQTEYIYKIAEKVGAKTTIAIMNAEDKFHRQMFRPNGGPNGKGQRGENGHPHGKKQKKQ